MCVRTPELSDAERYEAYSRLFRFEKEEDIDAKDFAAKTGLAVNSVASMIRHAKQNAKLYEEMVELGYSDERFPSWWFSPGREGQDEETVVQPSEGEQEGDQRGRGMEREAGDGRGSKEETFDPTPPDTPRPREARLGRPPLPGPAPSSPVQPRPARSSPVQPGPAWSIPIQPGPVCPSPVLRFGDDHPA